MKKMKLTGVDATALNPNGKQVTPVRLEDLPLWISVGRRGRRFGVAAEEVGLAEITLRRAEAGTDLSLETVQKLAGWLNVYVVVPPMGLAPDDALEGAPEETDVPEPEGEDPAEEGHHV